MFPFDTVANMKTIYPISITDSQVHQYQYKKIIYEQVIEITFLHLPKLSPRYLKIVKL